MQRGGILVLKIKSAKSILSILQKELKVSKDRKNDNEGFSYRHAEDILAATKPLLIYWRSRIVLEDEVVVVGERYYVKSTVTLYGSWGKISSVSQSREPEKVEGMNESWITGAASSYSRKYALCGLLAIDSGEFDIEAVKPPKAPVVSGSSIASSQFEPLQKETKDSLLGLLRSGKIKEEKQRKNLLRVLNITKSQRDAMVILRAYDS